jgi:hypothetical protein
LKPESRIYAPSIENHNSSIINRKCGSSSADSPAVAGFQAKGRKVESRLPLKKGCHDLFWQPFLLPQIQSLL